MLCITRPFSNVQMLDDRKKAANEAGFAEVDKDGNVKYAYGKICLTSEYSPKSLGVVSIPVLNDKGEEVFHKELVDGESVDVPTMLIQNKYGKGKPFAVQDEEYVLSKYGAILEKC